MENSFEGVIHELLEPSAQPVRKELLAPSSEEKAETQHLAQGHTVASDTQRADALKLACLSSRQGDSNNVEAFHLFLKCPVAYLHFRRVPLPRSC